MSNEQDKDEAESVCSGNDPAKESVNIYNAEADTFFVGIQSDLTQIDRLVSEAVNNLVVNFKYISRLTKSHHEMVMMIEKLAIPNESEPILELLRKQMVIAENIDQELEAAMTSLQFGDLVTQLLAHTAKQIEMFNRVLQRIDSQDNLAGKQNSLTEIQHSISQAIHITQSQSKEKPVVQQAMHKGEIELF